MVDITKVITVGIAKMLGKSVEEMKNLTKSTKEAGEEAKKATAGFDTLQTVDTSSKSSSGNGANMDFNALRGDIDKEISILTAIVSGAALVLGVILAFTGANIPLGIGLIAIGAVGLAASVAANWGTMEQKTKDSIIGVMAIGGALFLLLGLVLILTGVGIPLGIGLIFLGASLLYASYALSPGNSFVDKVKNLWISIKKIVAESIKWIRDNVIDDLLGEGFGKAFEDLFADVSVLCEDIVDLFKNLFEGDLSGVGKSLLNIFIGLINILIDGVNLIIQFSLQSIKRYALDTAKLFELFGIKGVSDSVESTFKKTEGWLIPHVPRLATGAVIPGGSPFLAMLGDQPKGQTNIEAPLDTLIEAFKAAQGTPNFTVEATGSMSQLIRMLRLQIKQENTRASIF